MLRQIIRLFFRKALNFFESLFRYVFYMTKMTSAQETCSGVTGDSASWLRPPESTSIPGVEENTCSAVGLRRRFWEQTKSTRTVTSRLTTKFSDRPPAAAQARGRKAP